MEGTVQGTIAALLLFSFFQLCGTWAAGLCLKKESSCAVMLMGSVCGSVMLQWFPLLFAFSMGFTVKAHLLGAGLAILCPAVIWAANKGRRGKGMGFPAFRLPRRKFLLVVLGLTVFFCFLVWKSFLFQEGSVYSSQATYGDMSMHLSFITSLAKQGNFPPDYSILPGQQLSYPFLGDSISSSLYLFGASLKLSYVLPMWFAGAQVIFGSFMVFCRIFVGREHGRGMAMLSWALFFTSGGLGFIYFIGGGWENFTRIFTAFYETPTNLIGENVRWVNVIADMMLPQRALLFGWAVLFTAIYLLYTGVFQGRKEYFLFAGILIGALPMIHTHSFLALALVCGAWLVYSVCQRLNLGKRAELMGKWAVAIGLPAMAALKAVLRSRELEDSRYLMWFAMGAVGLFAILAAFLVVRAWLKGLGKELAVTWGVLLSVVCILALPQLFTWTLRQAGTENFIRGHFGWVTGEDGYLWFYLKNMGLVFVLGIIGLLTCRRGRFSIYSPVLIIWFVAEFVEFQPNDYDNNKLLYVAYIFLCCVAAEGLFRLLEYVKGKRTRSALLCVAAVVSMCSAVLTWGREAVARYELFGSGALELCRYVEEQVPAKAVILTNTRHNNEIAALTGRNVVCGSPSYLYYHGLNYWENEGAVAKIYTYPRESGELIQRYAVSYILVSDFERSSYEIDIQALDRLYTKVYDDGERILYKVTEKGE